MWVRLIQEEFDRRRGSNLLRLLSDDFNVEEMSN